MYAFTLSTLTVKLLSFCAQPDRGYIIYIIEISVITGSAAITRALLKIYVGYESNRITTVGRNKHFISAFFYELFHLLKAHTEVSRNPFQYFVRAHLFHLYKIAKLDHPTTLILNGTKGLHVDEKKLMGGLGICQA